jgi:hypothetical protein
LVKAKPASREKGKQQQAQALVQKTKQEIIQPAYPIAFDTRGYRARTHPIFHRKQRRTTCSRAPRSVADACKNNTPSF